MSPNSFKAESQAHDFTRRITAQGLAPFALFVLEAGRPLAFVLAQMLWVAQPLFRIVWQPQLAAQWAHFLEEPGNIDLLIKELESEA